MDLGAKAATPTGKGKAVTVSKASSALRDHVQTSALPTRVRFRGSTELPKRVVVVTKQTSKSSASEARALIETTKQSAAHGPDARQAASAPTRGDQRVREDALAAPIDAPATLGRLLGARRKSLGLSQQTLADLARVGRRFVSELEAGKPTLELGKVLAVCRAAGVRLMAVGDDQ